MNKEIRIVPWAIKDLEFITEFGIVWGKAFTKTVFDVKECRHVTLGMVGKIPEGDESKSGGPMRYSEGDLVLTRHDAGDGPHKILEVEPHLVEVEGRISLSLVRERESCDETKLKLYRGITITRMSLHTPIHTVDN